jgi:putative DNA primase/helicase
MSLQFDQDSFLFNVINGTVDLRTGELRKHRQKDWITREAPVIYDPTAEALRFEQFLLEIMEGDTSRVDFLQRWFGYCATGETSEQKMVLHIGPGANGKSTLLDAVASVFGEYAGTAPPNLLTAPTSDRHPAEIADLAGRRLVTAHESDEGSILREALLKQATGGDRLKARFMRQDFFEFSPTHKLQLLTNHKPTVRGQDYALWRRLLLVWYRVSFGSTQDVIAGLAAKERDLSLGRKLAEERFGIFNWVVKGAVEWYKNGLNPPDSVIEASAAYRIEQDRLLLFVADVCILDPTVFTPINGPFGLYGAYTRWCKDNGYHSIASSRFANEIERVPGVTKTRHEFEENGVRKSQLGVKGLSINIEGDGGGFKIA